MADAQVVPSQPPVKEGAAVQVLKDVFGLTATSIKQLDSFFDCNYLVTVEDGHSNGFVDHLWPHGYLLKFTNKEDTLKLTYLETQCQVLMYLKENGIDVPQPIKNKQGAWTSLSNIHPTGRVVSDEEISAPHGSYCVRLFTYLPETPIPSLKTPPSTKLLYEVGRYMATVVTILQKSKFTNEEYQNHMCPWGLENRCFISDKIKSMKDTALRDRLSSHVEHFHGDILPKLRSEGRLQPIHGDFNPFNILVKTSETSEPVISGLIDIYDTSIGYVVFEVAICIMHFVTEFQDVHDVFEIGGHILAGFLSVLTLSDMEFGLIQDCLRMRLTQVAAIGQITLEGEGKDNDYIRRHTETAMQALRHFEDISSEDLRNKWETVIARYST